MPKPPKPEYGKVIAGDIIAIGDDQWYVSNVNYLPSGYTPYEGSYAENDTDTLAVKLLRVNPEKP